MPATPCKTAEFASACSLGDAAKDGRQRRLLTKRGSLLGRPLRRWCVLEEDELVYYSSRDALHPKGRIPLRDCTCMLAQGMDPLPSTGSAQRGNRGRNPIALKLVREGKKPCQIHVDSADELASVMAHIRGQSAVQSDAQTPGNMGSSSSSTAPVSDSTVGFGVSQMSKSPSVANKMLHKDVVLDEKWPAWGRAPQTMQTPRDKEEMSPRMAEGSDLLFGRLITGDGGPTPDGCSAESGEISDDIHFLPNPQPRNDASARSAVDSEDWVVPLIADESPIPLTPVLGTGIDSDLCRRDPSCCADEASEFEDHISSGVAAPPAICRGPAEAPPLPPSDPKQAYHDAMELMWDYDLQAAQALLEPHRRTNSWHACAYAECVTLKVVLTGFSGDAMEALESVREAEALRLADRNASLSEEVLAAEIMMLRSILQIFLGSRLRALYNLRQCWYAYRSLRHHVSADHSVESSTDGGSTCSACVQTQPTHTDKNGMLSIEDIAGRINFGLGFFYLGTSMMPLGISPILRLAGFVMDRRRGKSHLAACVEHELGPRATMAGLLLSMYHFDVFEPDMKLAGRLLVERMKKKPNNVLLHWAGSILAWRVSELDGAFTLVKRAQRCCGHDLSGRAVYLRYELGMLHFISMSWPKAHRHLRYVYDTINKEKVFFPYKSLVTTQLAAVAFSMGHDQEGEALCSECAALTDWSGALHVEGDMAKVTQMFLKRRLIGRQLLAFEVMYLLRQFPRVPPQMLVNLQAQICRVMQPYRVQYAHLEGMQGGPEETCPPHQKPHAVPKVCPNSPEMGVLIEYVSAQTIHCIILFYLGDVDKAMTFVPQLWRLCLCLPAWASYLAAHGLYWCGRILALSNNVTDALVCLRQAKAHKKYPFNISAKVSQVLAALEEKTCGS